MKHIVMLCDGLADWPIESLGGRTPVEAARTPNMDELARRGAAGTAKPRAGPTSPWQRSWPRCSPA